MIEGGRGPFAGTAGTTTDRQRWGAGVQQGLQPVLTTWGPAQVGLLGAFQQFLSLLLSRDAATTALCLLVGFSACAFPGLGLLFFPLPRLVPPRFLISENLSPGSPLAAVLF